ncbi:hypothetical protein [Streptomyces noursei]|uniref:hypothetical protein n=1 Tax=Streptomyces noursei TaxID=1971 RepID=UPI001F04AD46|nr:hypothetical protein [Streptomyces noursei]
MAEAAGREGTQVFVGMFEQFIPANQALFDAVRTGIYGRLEQLTLWNWTAHLWPGVSLGLRTLPLEDMHSDMDIITRTLGRPRSIDVTTVARDGDSAAIEAMLGFDGAFARDWGLRPPMARRPRDHSRPAAPVHQRLPVHDLSDRMRAAFPSCTADATGERRRE